MRVLVIIDGNPGLRAALRAQCPQIAVQRCTAHKLRNLLSKAPVQAQEELAEDYRRMIWRDPRSSGKGAQGVPQEMAPALSGPKGGGSMIQWGTNWGNIDHGADKVRLQSSRPARGVWLFRLITSLVLGASVSIVSAATLPSGFMESLVASDIASPTAIAFAPDGRLFVCEQGGRLRVIKNNTLLATPFVTLSVNSNGERGLLGVAFDPNFATNEYVYVYYTTKTTPIQNRVSRFTANGDVALVGSETVIFDLDNLSSATNHNGGALHFGTDGKLYIAVGDNANGGNSQTLSNLLGKMLRINPDGTIPTSNPFYNSTTGKNQAIWALGLRNPFTFAVQPETGDIFINDVGQGMWEEINEGIAGANYGWPATEGYTSDPRYVTPLYAYDHSVGCAITGGAFYNSPVNQFPSGYIGDYFFADYCGGWINTYDPVSDTTSSFASSISSPVDLQVGSDGSLYYLARGSGSTTGVVYRVQYTVNQAPTITMHPVSQTVPVDGSATFSVTASGTAPLSYQWQRNGTNISGATSASYTLSSVTLADNGAAFWCIVANAFGSATSDAAILTVTSNRAPTGTITSPTTATLYNAGDTITYEGTGTDPEDDTLPPSAFTWEVVFHHDTHTHPFIPPTSGATSGSFVIPSTGETSADVWYRIYLTVKDSGGLTHISFRDVRPYTATLQLVTNPSGLQVTLDGQPQTTPVSVLSVVGMIRTLGVVSPQTVSGVTYSFNSWSDGDAATHTITTPATNTTYTASYEITLNLLLNPGFELDANNNGRPDNWTSNSKFTRNNVVVLSGSFVGRHFAINNSGSTISQVVNNLTPGTTYSFSGWVNIPATSDTFTFRFQVRWRNASNSTISTQTIKTYTAATSGWDNTTASLVAPAGTTNAQVRMVVSNLNATIYVDDLVFGP